MSEDSRKGISLRTKRKGRPAISAPKQISAPIQKTEDATPRNTGGRPSQDPPQRPQAGGKKTSDLVKRRYSTRFTNLPSDYDATVPPIPSVPSVPGQYDLRNDTARGESPGRGVVLKVDKEPLSDPTLNAEKYITDLVTNATEKDINQYEKDLKVAQERSAVDIQQNVYQHRTQFIKISKEAEKLKSEMRILRNLMADLKANTPGLRTATSLAGQDPTDFDDGFTTTLSKRDKRSSVADRTAMWNAQLQALWKSIEGSQKFLPAAPGRHVIQDAGSWIELDNATWKPRRTMHIILLNDHLLVAYKKKVKVEGAGGPDSRQAPSRRVADRCWPLLDIEMLDLAGANDSASGRHKVADAIMIRGVGQESFTYRTNGSEGQKPSLMLNFRKAVEELRKGQRSEIENSNKAQDTINYFASRDPGLLKKAELLETLSEKDRSNMLIEVDGKQQNLRWVDGQIDELDIDIALQRFESAVDAVENLVKLAKGVKNNLIAQEFIIFKVDERSPKLAALVTRELVDSHNNLTKTQRNTGWLTRLGFEDRAREAYLEARSQIIKKRFRQCIFEGNLHDYMWQISFIYFQLIRNTVSTFQVCFPPLMMSSCIKWAKEQIDDFNLILARQLSSTEQGGPVWNECMNQAKEHAKMLSEAGLDLGNLIGQNIDRSTTISADGPVGLGLI